MAMVTDELLNARVNDHMALLTGLNELYAKKNHDYGDSFHESFLEEGFAMARIRLSDKLSRFKTLSRAIDEETLLGEYRVNTPESIKAQQVRDESMRDTLLDLANYAVMTVMEIDRAEREKSTTTSAEIRC